MLKIFKKILLPILLISHISSNSQLRENRSLEKFSYLIYGKPKSNQLLNGTVFFYKKNAKSYIITAFHVLTSWDPMRHLKEVPYPDILYVRLPFNGTFVDIPINIKSLKNKEYTKGTFEKFPDVIIHEIKIPEKYNVNYINKFIDKYSPMDSVIKNVVIIGYPLIKQYPTLDQAIQAPPDISEHIVISTPLSKPFNWNVSNATYGKDGLRIDSVDYLGVFKNNMGPGDSGAPVFWIDDKNQIVFGGLCFGGNPEKHLAYLVKPDVIIKMIEKL